MKHLPAALSAVLFIAASPWALAQGLPSSEQFKAWDARFKPGLYEFVDFELTKDGQPRDEGSAPRRECLDGMKTYFLGRGSRFADPMNSCQVIGVKLDTRGLFISHNCSAPEESKRPTIGTIVVAQTEPDTFLAIVAKQVHDPAASPPEPVAGTAHAFKRVDSCN